MALRDGALGDIKAPLAWLAGAAVIVAVAAAFALFVVDRRENNSGVIPAARRAADTAAAPVTGALSRPIDWARHGSNTIQDYLFAASQNRDLKHALMADQVWKDEVAALRLENARLRAVLDVKTEPAMPMVFARTILDARGPFANTRLADAGSAQGVIEGNPALSEHGLVGRVTGVSAQTSRIMLLTDVESRLPVLISRNNGRAILVGDGGPNPRLDYVRTSDRLRPGDRVLTSGDGGVLPRGLPVGAAVLGFDGQWRVALDADATPIDDVRILLFKDFSQLATPAALAPGVLPGTKTEAPVVAAPIAKAPLAPAPPEKTPRPAARSFPSAATP